MINEASPHPPNLPIKVMSDFLKKLRTDVWRTPSARYNASRRLKRREIFSTISLALFSSMSVAVAFVQRIYAVPASGADNYLTALSACLGIFLLTISLTEWGASTGAKAEALYKNAEDLNGLQRKLALQLSKLEFGQTLGWPEVDALAGEYESTKSSCRHNHEPIDDSYFRAVKRASAEFLNEDGSPAIGTIAAKLVTLRWHWASLWYFASFWIVIVVALILPFCFPAWWMKP